MRLLHVSKNLRHQHAAIGNADGIQIDGSSVAQSNRTFASRNAALIGLICISLIALVYAYSALSAQVAPKSNGLRNASIQLPSAGNNQSTSGTSAPGKASTVNVVANDTQNNSADNPSVDSTANVSVSGVGDNAVSTSMSVNGQTITTPADGSYVQTSVSPNQTTSVSVSNSHSNNGNSNGFSSTNEDLNVSSYSNSLVQEVE